MVFSWFDISYLSSNEKITKRGKLKVKDGPKVLKVLNEHMVFSWFKKNSYNVNGNYKRYRIERTQLFNITFFRSSQSKRL